MATAVARGCAGKLSRRALLHEVTEAQADDEVSKSLESLDVTPTEAIGKFTSSV